MSIFGIILICFLIFGFFGLLMLLPCIIPDEWDCLYPKIAIPVIVTLFIGGIFVGIGINTESEKVYVQKYLAQKQTIEISLAKEELSGFERAQLVTKATELNGEFAEKKSKF